MSHVREALGPEVDITDLTCWTDSKVALAWIKGEEREWKPFVQNRVNEIRTLVPVNSWRHCRGKNNPANIPSRGMSQSELSECALWIEGLRSRFWIVQGRQFVRKLLYECVICRRLEGRPYVAPPPTPLPEFRVKEEPPFTYVGIDFVGPLYVMSLNSPQQKMWICLYTCCVTRAIHLDLVQDLTSNAFLRCFRRFTVRRGRPSLGVSDNGRTFKPAAREITRIFNDPGVKQHFAREHMKWTFNLEKAPYWGGVFERLVKSVKRCLKKTISGARLTYEELLTVISEVEMILNCRPLSYVSSED